MLIKLYKKEDDILRYWEIWHRNSEFTVHWGVVGQEGTTKKIKLRPGEIASSIIEKEASPQRAAGYKEIQDAKLSQLVIQYPILEMGTTEDLDKRYQIENLMNQRLGWTGLGHCDGGDIGGGTMNVFCFVVDPELATQCIVEELKAHDALNGAKIILSEENDERQLFPIPSLKHTQ